MSRFSKSLSKFAVLIVIYSAQAVLGQTLEEQLQAIAPSQLAAEARQLGDAKRGAILFYQPHMACRSCHGLEEEAKLGPDLTHWKELPSDADLVDAILSPSKKIRQGFEAVSVLTIDGKVITGRLIENTPEQIVLQELTGAQQRHTIPSDEIEAQADAAQSLMPSGLANQLIGRQQFLDLVRYLIDVRDGGTIAARNLEPAPHLYAVKPIPEYEKRIDHVGMIAELNDASFQRGEAIYGRVCANCHGTHDQAGSLPTSPRFATGKLKNRTDPHGMYQTLTHGFGMMQPQGWMVPQQKYDVIHYIREAYFRPDNRSQYFEVDETYLAGLPAGDFRGPKPSPMQAWITMDYGPSLINTYEVGNDGSNFAYKGIATRLDDGAGGISRGSRWMIFDHDTMRMAAAWQGKGFIDWHGIHFDGKHGIHPRIVGDVVATNKTAPGWANPQNDSFDDPRVIGRDGRRYGPLPKAWAQYNGLYRHGNQRVVSYQIGDANILEMPELLVDSLAVFARHFEIAPRDHKLVLRVADVPEGSGERAQLQPWNDEGSAFVVRSGQANASSMLVAGLKNPPPEATFRLDGQSLLLDLPASDQATQFTLWFTSSDAADEVDQVVNAVKLTSINVPDLQAATHGGPTRWPEVIETKTIRGSDDGPFAADVLTLPDANPWNALVRVTGFDFYPGADRAAVCAWDGDVWLVDGLISKDGTLRWRRIATGLFQPLGLKIVDSVIYVTCRDQLVILRDLNGDLETDFYECFNNDHQVTEHFHEFAMGLQVDDDGNFYYAKSARHALPAIVPHHGTLLRVSADGSRTDILATGFRAANGVCLNPDGTFVVTDQEGHWNPKNRINWVEEGGFYGNMYGYHDVSDSSDAAMDPPLCWITNAFDRSPAELLWVPENAWGSLGGSLLNLSYGYGKVFVVPFENIDGQRQGGMCELPLEQFPTGLVRGRFHPTDNELYACGMFAWAGNQQQPGGFYRIRRTDQPVHLPIGLNASQDGIQITFTDKLDRESAVNPENYAITAWDLRRTKNYGSKHYNERTWKVREAKLSADGKTVTLIVPQIEPTWSMEIRGFLKTEDAAPLKLRIHNTIHRLSDSSSSN
ncbi:DUF6797 domain-containing protein [Bremerella alba]|nr:DUF6797 domain-containing protein [Bremerella alba]